ncbi:hypothetical protein SRHO_G00258320 [Serrasalmus rhombeus]
MDYYTVLKKTLFILTVYVHLTSVASHSLQYFCTGVIPGLHVPEFSVVRLVDGEQMVYYDSNIRKMIPKTEWMEKVDADNPLCWKKDKPKVQEAQESFKADMEHFMTYFNHTEGVHTVQKMYGCELHDDGSSTGYNQYGYDGEDFISLDLKTGTWTANHPKADIMKEEWERICSAMSKKAFLLNECIDLLQTYVEYGGSYLERKVHPEVSLFQKDSSSPVVCHATGFFPKAVMISWQKNGEDLLEDVELRETLPNQDGTFQKRSVLTVSPEELNRNQHSCVVQHDGLEREMKLQVSDRRVLRGGGSVGGSVGIILGAVVAVLLLVLIGPVGLAIWRKKPGCDSEGSSSTISSTSSE